MLDIDVAVRRRHRRIRRCRYRCRH